MNEKHLIITISHDDAMIQYVWIPAEITSFKGQYRLHSTADHTALIVYNVTDPEIPAKILARISIRLYMNGWREAAVRLLASLSAIFRDMNIQNLPKESTPVTPRKRSRRRHRSHRNHRNVSSCHA